MPPGSLVYVGTSPDSVTEISLISYDAITTREISNIDPAASLEHVKHDTVCWFNVVGLSRTAVIEQFAKQFDIHPLTVEDILNTHQRPKVDFHPKYIYVTLKMLYRNDEEESVTAEQVSLVLGENYVLSFQEVPKDVFGVLRERIRNRKGRIRDQKADYLLYCLLDAIVDNYFIVLEDVGTGLDYIHDMVLEDTGSSTMKRLHEIKKDIISLRRFIWPTREMITHLEKADNDLISGETKLYLRDVGEHALRTLETVETYREMATSAFEIFLSSTSNRMNEIMRVLTVISTFFIPLTFIAGIYGMNFRHMPELEFKWAYPATLILMLVIALCMAAFFKKRRWF